MQTFLPFKDFAQSAAVLDQKRLGKQRVETLQTIQRLVGARLDSWAWEDTGRVRRINVNPEAEGEDEMVWEEEPILRKVQKPREAWKLEPTVIGTGWDNHPIIKMWRGHELRLLDYQRAFCEEWVGRGYKDSCLEKSEFLIEHFEPGPTAAQDPWWLGVDDFHKSHQANLLRKVHSMTDEQAKKLGVPRDFYDAAFAADDESMEYFWPSHHEDDPKYADALDKSPSGK